MMPMANNSIEGLLPRRGRRDVDSDHEAAESDSEALVNKESKRVTAGRRVQPILPEMRYWTRFYSFCDANDHIW